MLNEQYKREMEQFGPRQEELEKLCTLIEGGTDMKWKKWLGRKAVVAIAACALLTVTAAAAAVPAVWQSLQENLGPFAPYAQYIKGASCTDQGIEIQVLSAISDDLRAQFYVAVRDVEEDRLNEFLTLTGRLTSGVEQRRDGMDPAVEVGGGWPSSGFELVSYDPDTKTALLAAAINYEEDYRPTGEANLNVTGMTTKRGELRANVPCASATNKTLKSLPVGKDDKVVFRASDLAGTEYTGDVLPSKKVVLAPGQTPMDIEGTEDMQVSSMGFASDGCFHLRLEFAEGVKAGIYENGRSAMLSSFYPEDNDAMDTRFMVCQQTLVEGGIDILFPLIKAEDLKTLQSGAVWFTTKYIRPGTEIEGEWSTEFEVEYYTSATLNWTGEVNGRHVRQVTLSPLSVTMYSNDKGGFHSATLYAVKKDGTEIAAEPHGGRYANMDAMGGEGYDAFNAWLFEEPLDLDEIVSLKLMDTEIPIK